MNSIWRDSARPRIAKVIAEFGTEDMVVLRRELREAYPYGEREHWPYKVWCDEIRRQLNALAPKPSAKDAPRGPLMDMMEVE